MEKIKLFLKLFRCRSDVYPRYWTNDKKNISGYSPVCHNEWKREICKKPKIKCTDCENQNFVIFDENVAKNHLQGKEIIGTYAINTDDTCIFLAADFDKSSWEQDVQEYKASARELGVEVAIERSKSGNGAHAWIFFSEAVSAKAARSLGMIIIA